jgi:hypothetical protein
MPAAIQQDLGLTLPLELTAQLLDGGCSAKRVSCATSSPNATSSRARGVRTIARYRIDHDIPDNIAGLGPEPLGQTARCCGWLSFPADDD